MAHRFTISMSDDLFEAAELLRKRRKYRTQSEYIAGLVRYDGQSQRDHLLTAEWAALSGYERDALDAAILQQVKTEKGVRGSWLEHRIEEIVKRYYEAGKEPPTIKEVATHLAHELTKENTGAEAGPK
jgi:Arc/MetJ-type ribon-helix-helix transcriptional regulator